MYDKGCVLLVFSMAGLPQGVSVHLFLACFSSMDPYVLVLVTWFDLHESATKPFIIRHSECYPVVRLSVGQREHTQLQVNPQPLLFHTPLWNCLNFPDVKPPITTMHTIHFVQHNADKCSAVWKLEYIMEWGHSKLGTDLLTSHCWASTPVHIWQTAKLL